MVVSGNMFISCVEVDEDIWSFSYGVFVIFLKGLNEWWNDFFDSLRYYMGCVVVVLLEYWSVYECEDGYDIVKNKVWGSWC